MSSFRVRLLDGFSDPACSPQGWQRLLDHGPTRTVFLTWHFLRAWWDVYAEDDLLLVAAERDGEIFSIVPLFSSEGTVCPLGSDESDYCDFIGDPGSGDVVAAMLGAAAARVRDFNGHQFTLVPGDSPTCRYLAAAAEQLGMDLWLRKEIAAVEVDLASDPAAVEAAMAGEMLRREKRYQKRGALVVRHLTEYEQIRPWLPAFFDQHIARWEQKGDPSPFTTPKPRAFLERFLKEAADTGWTRLQVLLFSDRPVGFEFAWYYQGVHFSGPWCFDVAESRNSPGQVLLRQSVKAAMDAGLRTYDLGLGIQPYKLRLPATTKPIQTWHLDPREPGDAKLTTETTESTE